MASYDIKRCPSCNQPYEQNFYSGKLKEHEKVQYGSPIKVCEHCQHEFLDKDYKEIAIDGIINEKEFERLTPGTVPYTLASFGLALFTWIISLPTLPVVFVVLGITIIGSDLISYKKRQTYIKKATEESQKRLEDPEYALRLLKLGVRVPYEFLPKVEEDI